MRTYVPDRPTPSLVVKMLMTMIMTMTEVVLLMIKVMITNVTPAMDDDGTGATSVRLVHLPDENCLNHLDQNHHNSHHS